MYISGNFEAKSLPELKNQIINKFIKKFDGSQDLIVEEIQQLDDSGNVLNTLDTASIEAEIQEEIDAFVTESGKYNENGSYRFYTPQEMYL